MKRQQRLLLITIAALVVCVAAVIPSLGGEASAQSATNKSSELLKQIADEVWQRKLKSPAVRLEQGLPIDELPRWSPAKAESDAAFSRDVLKKLETVNEQELSHEESLTLAVVRWDARNAVEGARYFWLRSPVTPYAFYLPTVHRILQTFRFERASDTDRYLDLLAEYPSLIEETHSHLRRQTDRGIVLPKEAVEQVLGFLKGFVQEPGKSLFNVSDQRLAAIDTQTAGRFKQQLAAEINARANPVLERLIAYVAGAYRERAPERVGLWQYPGGTDYYRYLVKMHTTMEVTPEDVHEIGLGEVKRLEREMAEVRNNLGFRGTKAEFHQFLKTDPRFFPKTPDEIRVKLLGFANGINAKLDKLFLARPKALFDTQRLSPVLEGSVTFGYYEAPRPGATTGTYYFNGSKLEERSLLQAEALIYHELVPGHHFHIASQQENDKLHLVRKNFYPTAYTEGWAMYAAVLGRELGQYQDLYDLYGHLSMEMMISVRLVVDTGMNHLKWPRSRAMEFIREYALLSESEIGTESLRYSTDIPAQALAYKMGEIKILELREQIRKSQSGKFDIRRFHQALLGSGA
ncbi:MAG: DUF885 domain-containing protein, partial [Pyrinomonadaceae bacterium]